jgi:hypothetical protein
MRDNTSREMISFYIKISRLSRLSTKYSDHLLQEISNLPLERGMLSIRHEYIDSKKTRFALRIDESRILKLFKLKLN